jgi:hypothetical protein
MLAVIVLEGIVFPSKAGAIESAMWGLSGQALLVPLLFWTTTKVPILADTLALSTFLNLEEQVADLVNYFGISARLTSRKTLVGGEDKV